MTKLRQGILLGSVLCIAVVATALWLTRDSIPPLTEESLAAAKQRWSEQGLADYEMTLQMSGDRGGSYEVSVRADEVRELRHDGTPVPQRGEAWRYWSVPGLFALIEMELADAKQESDDQTRRVRRSVEFDATNGRPTRYRSIMYGDVRRDIEWQILKFNAK